MSITSPRPAAIPAAGRRFRVHPRDAGHASHERVGHSLGTERGLQVALGLIWLTDGVLQLQPFMFTRSFVTQIITPNTIGQPRFVAWPITLAEHLIEPRVALFNAFVATLQILIGLGLLYRPTVKVALLSSFAWALGVWWIGEGLGGLFTGAASPLTGAPGAALLYVFAGRSVAGKRSAGSQTSSTRNARRLVGSLARIGRTLVAARQPRSRRGARPDCKRTIRRRLAVEHPVDTCRRDRRPRSDHRDRRRKRLSSDRARRVP